MIRYIFYTLLVGTVLFLTLGSITEPYEDLQLHTIEERVLPIPEEPIILVKPEPEEFSCEDDPECFVLAEAIYFEAGIEPFIGKVAVAHVIIHRTKLWYFPDTIKEVVYHRCQFTYTCNGDLKRGILKSSQQWKDSIYAAELVYQGIIPDPTGGADHYFNPNEVSFEPNWSKVYPQVSSIGLHQFHKRDH